MNKIFALRLGGGEMILNRKRGKGVVLLAALLVSVALLAIPVLAACPLGTVDLSDPTNYGLAPRPITAAGSINQAGTYCVPSPGVVLGAGGIPANVLTVDTENVTIVGETPCSFLQKGAGGVYAITVNRQNCTIHNFILRSGAAGHQAIDVQAMDCTIEGITFFDNGVGFGDPICRLGALNTALQNNEFDARNTNNSTLVQLNGGQAAQILYNRIRGPALALANPDFFVENAVGTYNGAAILGNNMTEGGVDVFVGSSTGAESFTNSEIAGSIAFTWLHGIDMGPGSTNTVVHNNQITYGASNAANGIGIWDQGGSNLHYLENTLTASTLAGAATAGDGIRFQSNNALIDGNVIDARGVVGAAVGDGIDAVNNGGAAPYPANAVITNNQILGTGDGDPDMGPVGVAPVAGYGISMSENDNTNFVITGNEISNTAAAGIYAAVVFAGPRGGNNHRISQNKLYNIGTAVQAGVWGNDHPIGTAITVNGNSVVSYNEIRGVRGGYGVFTTGSNDEIRGNMIDGVSDTWGGGIVVWHTASNPEIVGNTIRNVSGSDADGVGVMVSNATITDNTIDGVYGGHGIRLYDSETINAVAVAIGQADNCSIERNTITDVQNGIGIALFDNNNNTVVGNVIEDTSEDGVLAFAVNGINVAPPGFGGVVIPVLGTTAAPDAHNNDIRGNEITRAALDARDVPAFAPTPSERYAAIRAEGESDNNNIEANTIVNAGSASYAVGVLVLGGPGGNTDNNDIVGNHLSGFTTAGTTPTDISVGIWLLSGENNEVRDNTVENSGQLKVGIDVRPTDEVEVQGNYIEGMREIGLYLWGGTAADPLVVQENCLKDNVTGVHFTAGAADMDSCNLICGGAVGVYVNSLANAANFRFGPNNCVGCCIHCRNDGIGTLNAEDNWWANLPAVGVNVFGNVDYIPYLDEFPDMCDDLNEWCNCDWGDGNGGNGGITGPFCCTYPQGWNLISMPAVPSNPDAASIFDALPLYEYDACIGTYSTPTDVSSTEGYWLYLTVEQEFCIDGTVPLTDQTIVLPCAGWHLIGTCFDAYWLNTLVTHGAQMRNVADAGDWILLPVFSYDPVTHSYSAVTWLVPCLGYWVYTLVDNVTLTIPFAQPPTPTSVPLSTMELPEGLTPPPPPSLDGFFDQVEDGLVFTNVPNPVTDVHTTTFMVKGALSGLVEQIKVQVFDLTGRLIYEDQRTGTELTWHTDSSWGEYLANGIYLYRLSVLIDGQWIVSEVKKLAVMR